jgi:Ca2+/H+ antiporter
VTTRQRSSFTRVILGTLLVLAGLAAALVTVLARRDNNSTVAGIAAILSLLIALLLTIFIVPPLARSARVEVANLDFPFEPTSGGVEHGKQSAVSGFFSPVFDVVRGLDRGAYFVARPDGVGAFSGSHLRR